MGVRILHNNDEAVMYCSTSGWAFGPLMHSDKEHDAEERMELFLKWLKKDAREYEDNELEMEYGKFLLAEKSLWENEEEK